MNHNSKLVRLTKKSFNNQDRSVSYRARMKHVNTKMHNYLKLYQQMKQTVSLTIHKQIHISLFILEMSARCGIFFFTIAYNSIVWVQKFS